MNFKDNNRLIPLEEQEAEAKIAENIEEDSNKKSFMVIFTGNNIHSEIKVEEGSMKVALGRAFVKFKKALPKRTRIKELTITIKQGGR